MVIRWSYGLNRTLGQLLKNKQALICSVHVGDRGSDGSLQDSLWPVTQPAAVFSSAAAVSHFIHRSEKDWSDGTSPENSLQSVNSHVALWHLLLRKPDIPRQSYHVTFDLSNLQHHKQQPFSRQTQEHNHIYPQSGIVRSMPGMRTGGFPNRQTPPVPANGLHMPQA